jgi:ATP-dependent exoDNAse (exonuclease V) beta subunit
VLALDRGLFSPKTDRAADYSQLKFLRGNPGESSIQFLDALLEAPDTCPETAASWEQRWAAPEAISSELPPLSGKVISRARERAGEFMRKQNPSGYEEPADPPNATAMAQTPRPLPRSTADTPATLYGSWWHTLFEHFPWKADPSRWQEAFDALQPSSPDHERSAREWLQLRTTLAETPAAQFLRRPGTIVHTEFPFLWRIDERSCLEGVIDLLAVDPAEKHCLLLDWKTNRLTSGEEDELRARYLSQLAAYRKAIGEMTQFDVEAALFSTSLGRLLIYKDEELAAEWARLRRLGSDELSAAIGSAGLGFQGHIK